MMVPLVEGVLVRRCNGSFVRGETGQRARMKTGTRSPYLWPASLGVMDKPGPRKKDLPMGELC